jgi:hypothetical protein
MILTRKNEGLGHQAAEKKANEISPWEEFTVTLRGV